MNTQAIRAVDRLKAIERIALAKAHMEKMIGHVLHSIALHENNEIVLNSDLLSSQVPSSYGAHAFNLTRDALFRYSVIRLCALWDAAEINSESILTVIDLVDNREVILMLMRENCGHRAGRTAHVINLPEEPELEAIVLKSARDSEDRFGRTQGYRAGRQWRSKAGFQALWFPTVD